ncbi:MAG: MFS transporter [Corynebacterium sp.]|nr:MFS transporter [Corynebacterium sp.]
METQQEKLFNAGFVGITLINFFVYMVYYLLVTIIAFVASEELHASTSAAGLATGIYIIGTLLARLYFGKTIEMMGRKAVLRWGAIFYLVTTLMYFWIPGMAVLFIIRFLNGFFYGMVSTATNTIVTAYIPKARQGEGINYYGLSTALAAALGPFIGSIILHATNFTVTLIVCVVLVAISTAGALFFPAKNIEITEAMRKASKDWSIKSLLEPRVYVISVVGFFMGLSYAAVVGFLNSYAASGELVDGIIVWSSFFFLVYALVVAVTRPVLGRVFDRFGESSVLYPSYLFLAIGCWILMGISHIGNVAFAGVTMLIAGALIGLGYGNFMSNGQAVCLKLVTAPSRVGVALSTYFIGLDLGLGVGPFFHGMLHSALGSWSNVYIVAGVISIVAMAIYKFFYKGLTEEEIAARNAAATTTVQS